MSNHQYMEIAKIVAKSDRENTQVGAVLVSHGALITGRNALPDYVDGTWSEDQLDRVDRHAERSVIDVAAKAGLSTNHASLYITHTPCLPCANSIVASGISDVYICEENHIKYQHRKKWAKEWEIVNELFIDSRVKVEFL